MIDRGTFAPYEASDQPEGLPAGYRAFFWKNAAGVDWYDFRKATWLTPLTESYETPTIVTNEDGSTSFGTKTATREVGWTDNSGTRKVSLINGTVSSIVTDVQQLSLHHEFPFQLLELQAGEASPNPADKFVDGAFVPPTPPMPNLSRRQFYQGLVGAGIISEDDFFTAMAGQLPPPIAAIVAQLPTTAQFTAKALLVGASTFQRTNPLVVTFAQLTNHDDVWLDEFWTTSSAL